MCEEGEVASWSLNGMIGGRGVYTGLIIPDKDFSHVPRGRRQGDSRP